MVCTCAREIATSTTTLSDYYCADVVYGGRLLRDSRVISDYGIKSGATLFVLKKKKKAVAAGMCVIHMCATHTVSIGYDSRYP